MPFQIFEKTYPESMSMNAIPIPSFFAVLIAASISLPTDTPYFFAIAC